MIAVIGGGPAGSFFAHFARQWAEKKDIELTVTIFDGKDFLERGPRGCNLCAGVIASGLEERLEEEGLVLPESRVLSRLEGYTLHFGEETLNLAPPRTRKKSIATVFRGNGPRYSRFPEAVSFDDYLLSWAQDSGARVIPCPVQKIIVPSSSSKKAAVVFGERNSLASLEADLVVGAFGVNTFLMGEVEKLGFGYRPPRTLRTFQAEFNLGAEEIKTRFGNNIHVYLSPSRTIRYATAVPKGNFLTVTVAGKKDISPFLLQEFFILHPLGKTLPRSQLQCFCFPRISISAARRPFFHRLVLVGDASFSRHYKNGIESAFLTARLAAEAVFERGVDDRSLAEAYFRPARALIVRDNLFGRLLFRINDIISSVPRLALAHMSLASSPRFPRAAAEIRHILWDMFTGDTAYGDIFRRVFSLRLQTALLYHTIKVLSRRTAHFLSRSY